MKTLRIVIRLSNTLFSVLLLTLLFISNGHTESSCEISAVPMSLVIYEGESTTIQYRVDPPHCTTCVEWAGWQYYDKDVLVPDSSKISGTRYLGKKEFLGGGSWGQACDLSWRGTKTVSVNHSGTNSGAIRTKIKDDPEKKYEPASEWKYVEVYVLPHPKSFQGFNQTQEQIIEDVILEIGELIYEHKDSCILNNKNIDWNLAKTVRERLRDELHNLDNITFINKEIYENGRIMCEKWDPYTNNIYLNLKKCNYNETTIKTSIFHELLRKAGANSSQVDSLVRSCTPDYYEECVARINHFRKIENVRENTSLQPLQRYKEKESCADAQAKTDSEVLIPHYANKNNKPDCGESLQNESCVDEGKLCGSSSVDNIIGYGGSIDRMYNEKYDPTGEQGHYRAIVNPSKTKVACGIYKMPDDRGFISLMNFY